MGAAPFPCPRASVPHARARVAAPPPAWYTGAGHPADGRRPHARRAASLHERGHTSPLEPVGPSATRAGDTHGGRATVATAHKICTLGSKKSHPCGVVAALHGWPDHGPQAVSGRYLVVADTATIRSTIIPRHNAGCQGQTCKNSRSCAALRPLSTTPARSRSAVKAALARSPWP